MRLLLTALVFCVVSSQAWACTKEPDPLPIDNVIEQAQRIVLARVVSGRYIETVLEDDNRWWNLVDYTFETIEVIKGDKTKNDFVYQGRPVAHSRDVDDYNKHSDQKFWDDKHEGRTPENCMLPLLALAVGSRYLIIEQPNFPKAFEVIFYDDDKWLQYVRDKVKEQASELSNE